MKLRRWLHGVVAVYLDDQLSSVRIQGCTFDQIDGRLMTLGGGRHNEFINNLVVLAVDETVILLTLSLHHY